MDGLTISAVAFREGDVWIVQCIEYDICTQAKHASAVPAAFKQAIIEHIAIAHHLGKPSFKGLRPAPARFREMFERALPFSALNGIDVPDLPAAAMNIRVAEAA
jgi:hypothetical protein